MVEHVESPLFNTRCPCDRGCPPRANRFVFKRERHTGDHQALGQAWERFDGQLLANDYTVDADFMDAFGNRHTGSATIVGAMTRQLTAPQVQQRKTTWKPAVIRFVRADVALVYHDYETVGQQTTSGEPVPPRDTRSIRTVAKTNGEWRIISHFIMDTRQSAARR